jgi:hypothetical protein
VRNLTQGDVSACLTSLKIRPANNGRVCSDWFVAGDLIMATQELSPRGNTREKQGNQSILSA